MRNENGVSCDRCGETIPPPHPRSEEFLGLVLVIGSETLDLCERDRLDFEDWLSSPLRAELAELVTESRMDRLAAEAAAEANAHEPVPTTVRFIEEG